MLEKKHEHVLPMPAFVRRMALFFGLALLLIAVALGIGVAGYHWIAHFSLVDSVLSASMILTGMGPVGELPSTAAKLFASAYALFSGLMFISVMGVILTPVAHRLLHRFHFDNEGKDTQA